MDFTKVRTEWLELKFRFEMVTKGKLQDQMSSNWVI